MWDSEQVAHHRYLCLSSCSRISNGATFRRAGQHKTVSGFPYNASTSSLRNHFLQAVESQNHAGQRASKCSTILLLITTQHQPPLGMKANGNFQGPTCPIPSPNQQSSPLSPRDLGSQILWTQCSQCLETSLCLKFMDTLAYVIYYSWGCFPYLFKIPK